MRAVGPCYSPKADRHHHEPFLIRHIGLVSARLANMLIAGGWGPHGGSGVGLSNPLESHSTPATEPLSKRPLKDGDLAVLEVVDRYLHDRVRLLDRGARRLGGVVRRV